MILKETMTKLMSIPSKSHIKIQTNKYIYNMVIHILSHMYMKS